MHPYKLQRIYMKDWAFVLGQWTPNVPKNGVQREMVMEKQHGQIADRLCKRVQKYLRV